MSSDPAMWRMARQIALANGLGDIDKAPESSSDAADPDALFGFLELHRATGKSAHLEIARRIGDSLLATRFHKGYFVKSANHPYAKFDTAEALALLHLVAALEGKPHAAPAYVGSGAFFAAAYGKLGHRYDHEIIYGQTRPPARQEEDF